MGQNKRSDLLLSSLASGCKRKAKAPTKPYNPWNLQAEITVAFRKHCFYHCQMLSSEHHGNQSPLPCPKFSSWRDNEPKSQIQSRQEQHTHSHQPFSTTHIQLSNETDERGRKYWGSSATQEKKLKASKTCKEKFRCETRMKKWCGVAGKSTGPGDAVAVRKASNLDPSWQKIYKAAPSPSSRERPKSESCWKSWGKNWEDRRRKAGVLHLRNSSRV